MESGSANRGHETSAGHARWLGTPGECSSVGKGIVRMEVDAELRMSGTNSMQRLGEAFMHIQICGHSAPFLLWNGCDVSGFGNVRGNYLFTGAPRSLEF